MQGKRIAILGTRGIPARYGGFETFAQELAVRLVERGFSVTVFGEESADCQLETEYQGVKLRYRKAPAWGPLSTLVFDVRCLMECRKGFDLVYMLGYGSAIFCLLTRLFGVKTWINMDGVEWQRSKWSRWAKAWFRLMEWVAVRVADRVIADADGIRDHLEQRHGKLRCCSVIPYGAYCMHARADPELLGQFAVSPYEYYLVVCRLEPENHVLEIIEGFLRSGSRFPLIIVGDKQVNNTYISHLLELSTYKVRFVGSIYDQRLLGGLRIFCRAYIHGHSVGGTNPSLLEAMGAGNVTIAHDNIFNHEVLGSAGLYFRDSDEIAAGVGVCDGMTAADRQKIASGVTARVKGRYTWELITMQYEQLIRTDL